MQKRGRALLLVSADMQDHRAAEGERTYLRETMNSGKREGEPYAR